MMFTERVMATPWVFALGCLVWVPVAVWTVSMVGWMVHGEIEALYGVLALAAIYAMAYLTTRPPDPVFSPFLFVGVLGTVVMYPVFRRSFEGRANRRIDLDLIAGAYETLAVKPDNVGPRIRMAEIVASRGMYATAVQILEPCVPSMAATVFPNELKAYASWRAAAWDANAYAPLPCPACGMRNPPGELYCRRCRGPFVLDRARGAWLGSGVSRRWLSSWLVGTLVVVGVPLVAHSGWPPAVVFVVVVSMMVSGLYVLVKAFGERGV